MATTNCLVIGIIGRKKCGKNTVAQYIENFSEYKVFNLAFADDIKQICTNLFDFPNETFFYNENLKEIIHIDYCDFTPREILQKFGNDCIKKTFGKDFWIKKIQRKINSIIENHKNQKILITLSDCRFENEIRFLLNFYNTKLIYIDSEIRLGLNKDSHVSEKEIYKIKNKFEKDIFFIDNNKSIIAFEEKIKLFTYKNLLF